MNNKPLKDWIDFCEGNKEFDDCYFYTLFHADPLLEEQELYQIFKFFPNNNLLLCRMISFFKVKYFHESVKLTDNEIVNLVMMDIQEKLKILDTYGNYKEEANILSEALASPPIITNEESLFDEKVEDIDNNLDTDVYDLVGDTLIDILNTKKTQVWALLEAFYGLTNNFTLSWYLSAPLYLKPVDFNTYFNLWKANSDYVITNNKILIYTPIERTE